MILFINTSKTNLIQLKLILNNKVIDQLESHEEFRQSELLLSMIDKIFKKNKVRLPSLKYLAIVTGPGAFSALRLGIATANAMAWALNIPIIELNSDEASLGDKELVKLIARKSKLTKSFKQAVPKYGKEPNITTPKVKRN